MNARLLVLLVLLALQSIGWLLLSRQAPYFTRARHTQWHSDQLQVAIEDSDYRVERHWFGSALFDLENEQWHPCDRYHARHAVLKLNRNQYWRIREHNDRPTATAECVDRDNHVLKSREVPKTTELVDQRWAVYENNSQLMWLDLDVDQSTFQAITGIPDGELIYWHNWSGPSLVLQREISTTKLGPVLTEVDLVLFDNTSAKTVATWAPGVTPNFYEYLDAGDTIASWDRTGKALEFRSKSDGQLIHTEAMPPGVDYTGMQWGLPTKLVHIHSPAGVLNYDLHQRRWLDVPAGYAGVARFDNSHVCLLLDEKRQRHLYNMQQQRMIPADLSHFGAGSFHIHDNDVSICTDGDLYPRFHFISNQDGQLIKTYAPFKNVPWYLGGWMLAYIVWANCWMRESTRAKLWAGIDVLLIVGVPTVWFCCRHASAGPAWNMWRLSYQYLWGGSVGLLALCVLWLALGRSRWSIRLVPLLLLEAYIVLVARLGFGDQVDILWRWLGTLNLSAMILLAMLFCLRWLGRRWTIPATTHERAERQRAEQGESPRLSDYFVLMLCVALIIVAAGSTVSLSQFTLMRLQAWEACLTAGVMLAMLMSCFSQRRWLFTCGLTLCGLCLAVLLAEPFTRLAGFGQLEQSLKNASELRGAIACGVGVFVGGVPYRLRGFRVLGFPRQAVGPSRGSRFV